MAQKTKKTGKSFLTINCIAVQNRRARYDYHIEEEFEAGLMLVGTEVKSLRTGQANLTDAYAEVGKDGAVWLINCYIPEYNKAMKGLNHNSRRERKLLLHEREIKRLMGKVQAKGYTLIPLDIHFNKKGIAKVKLGLAKGKTNYDKRQSEKEKEWKQQQRGLREE